MEYTKKNYNHLEHIYAIALNLCNHPVRQYYYYACSTLQMTKPRQKAKNSSYYTHNTKIPLYFFLKQQCPLQDLTEVEKGKTKTNKKYHLFSSINF